MDKRDQEAGITDLLQVLIENNAIPDRGGCSIYALAIAISLLVPEKRAAVPALIYNIIHAPFESTPLVNIALQNGLRPPINLTNGGTFATAWIAEGFGEPLEDMLNGLLREDNYPITAFHKFHPLLGKPSGEVTNPVMQDIIKYCKSGSIALISCIITQNKYFIFKHHLALAFIENSWRIYDINFKDYVEIPDHLISQLINDPHPDNSLPYIDNLVISVAPDPVIFIKRNET